MVRVTLCTLALLALAATPIACDNGGGGGEDILVADDTTQDSTQPPTDSADDTTPPPLDSLEDTAPPPDTSEDIPWEDIPWTDLPWEDISVGDIFDVTPPDIVEDIPCDIPEDIPDLSSDVPCDPPSYSEDCAEVPGFQCGFYGWCAEGVVHAEWHEHVFCDGQEIIVDYSCTHACEGGCEDGDIMDWPEDGPAFIEGYCKAVPGCDMPPLYASVTLPDLLGDLAAYDGQKVGFVGHVLIGGMMCGAVECTPEDPCCQPCGASYEVTGPSSAIEIAQGQVSPVGCSGNNCTVLENCTPFPAADKDYLLWGTVEKVFSMGVLYLDGWCPAP